MGIFVSFYIRVRLPPPTAARLCRNKQKIRLSVTVARQQAERSDTWIQKFTKMQTCNTTATKRKPPDFILSGSPADARKFLSDKIQHTKRSLLYAMLQKGPKLRRYHPNQFIENDDSLLRLYRRPTLHFHAGLQGRFQTNCGKLSPTASSLDT